MLQGSGKDVGSWLTGRLYCGYGATSWAPQCSQNLPSGVLLPQIRHVTPDSRSFDPVDLIESGWGLMIGVFGGYVVPHLIQKTDWSSMDGVPHFGQYFTVKIQLPLFQIIIDRYFKR